MYNYDAEEEAGGSFVLGLVAGVALGAGLGLLLAPRAGAETRRRLSESAERVKHTAADRYHKATETVGQVVDRGRQTYDKARESVKSGIDAARHRGEKVADAASEFGAETRRSLETATDPHSGTH